MMKIKALLPFQDYSYGIRAKAGEVLTVDDNVGRSLIADRIADQVFENIEEVTAEKQASKPSRRKAAK